MVRLRMKRMGDVKITLENESWRSLHANALETEIRERANFAGEKSAKASIGRTFTEKKT